MHREDGSSDIGSDWRLACLAALPRMSSHITTAEGNVDRLREGIENAGHGAHVCFSYSEPALVVPWNVETRARSRTLRWRPEPVEAWVDVTPDDVYAIQPLVERLGVVRRACGSGRRWSRADAAVAREQSTRIPLLG